MDVVQLSLLRGVCQLPGYVAHAEGYFRENNLDVRIRIAPTAWTVPQLLISGEMHFAVMPWTRVAAASVNGEPLVLVCGSGCEEAAVVVRSGIKPEEVRKVAVPQRGGIKDLTAMGLMRSLGWEGVDLARLPSGDGAILSLVGRGADAATMVEPYATMLQELGIGTIVRRTGDLWPGAPGCSLTTTSGLIASRPDLVQRVVSAFVRGAELVAKEPDAAAAIGAKYIAIDPNFIRTALRSNRPNVHALRNTRIRGEILAFMQQMGYLESLPGGGYDEGRFLDQAAPVAPANALA